MHGVIHMDASGDDDPPLESLPDLHDELFLSGIVDGSVAVINDDTGWCLFAHHDGRLIFGHLGENNARQITPVTKDRVLALWHLLIRNDMEALLAEPWKPGYVERNASGEKLPGRPCSNR